MSFPGTLSQRLPVVSSRSRTSHLGFALPALLFVVTAFSTTAVGARYMQNFRLGRQSLLTESDLLPFAWAAHHLRSLGQGLPFSVTLLAILLTHEFAHYAACRHFNVRCTLPYLLPAPSLSGTFGAVIRIQSTIRSRTALIAIGASGPIAGFLVAVAGVITGLRCSTFTSPAGPLPVQSPLAITLAQRLLHLPALHSLVPHPVLIASWIGLLITALNLIPAGQLDGGHIVYAISPAAHRRCSQAVVIVLLALGIFFWAGWLLWAAVLQLPFMRHPRVADRTPLPMWAAALVPACATLLLLSATVAPFHGFSLLTLLHR